MIITTTANSWNEVTQALLPHINLAFRGQVDASWPLETSLYREAERQGQIGKKELHKRESWLLYQFRRFAHLHKSEMPSQENVLDWLALIQHYGGPTRLLDFTRSLYVAAFFAIETASSDAAIWSINRHALIEATQEKLGIPSDGLINEVQQAHNVKFEELVSNNTQEVAVIQVEPDKLHERLWMQQGLFLAPTNPDMPFMKNLIGTFKINAVDMDIESAIPWNDELVERLCYPCKEEERIYALKIILPRRIHEEIKNSFRAFNVNASTLFPGLEGIARSLRFHI
jgi:hypothetical protein